MKLNSYKKVDISRLQNLSISKQHMNNVYISTLPFIYTQIREKFYSYFTGKRSYNSMKDLFRSMYVPHFSNQEKTRVCVFRKKNHSNSTSSIYFICQPFLQKVTCLYVLDWTILDARSTQRSVLLLDENLCLNLPEKKKIVVYYKI